METKLLRRKDTTKGPPLRVLSLDGGGVRGYSMLILLQELMHRTYVEIEGRAPRRDQIPKPCDHFDLIAGTGTGGLIAIMLGRLRLDLETCKEVYVRMTRRVFETDKTIAGIPYRSTLFKASKLEEAIKECVREHTIFDDEGNDNMTDNTQMPMSPMSPMSPMTPASAMGGFSPRRSLSVASTRSGMNPVNLRGPLGTSRWGNPNASLYDSRENRTKTAVTAVYKGTPKNGAPALLRSYDSRKEPAPEFNCTIWQAGRATSATGLAFKPIQIGQSVFIDEGAGKYNPSPYILDEAAVNEWPGREVGVFVSIGTGKRPSGTNNQQHLWWEGFVSSGIGDFAEARRRLISKIEGCEDTHQYMMSDHLAKRGVNPENYYRLNVEVGVGEFGMNEWNRLADISTSTRRYMAKNDVQKNMVEAAAKMARIQRAKLRHENHTAANEWEEGRLEQPLPDLPNGPNVSDVPPPSDPMAVELPAEEYLPPLPLQMPQQQPIYHQPTNQQADPLYPPPLQYRPAQVVSSDEYPQPVEPEGPPAQTSDPYRGSNDHINGTAGPRSSSGSIIASPRRSGDGYAYGRPGAPPLPPKTPLPYLDARGGRRVITPPRSNPGIKLPYPDTDGPPPAVNMARKPEYGGS
ncbi:MAG: hypothetical protein M1819_001038 [Sarea resinae]|nr:MAG: hypothetical protein M1819_001038 [Sarea resinae]